MLKLHFDYLETPFSSFVQCLSSLLYRIGHNGAKQGRRYIGQSMKTQCCACIGYLLLAVCNCGSTNTLHSPPL